MPLLSKMFSVEEWQVQGKKNKEQYNQVEEDMVLKTIKENYFNMVQSSKKNGKSVDEYAGRNGPIVNWRP